MTRWGTGTTGTTQDVVTTFTYDSAGRKTQEFEKGRVQFYTYDAAGNLLTHAAGLGTVTMAYDALGRLTKRILPAVTNSGTTCLARFYPDYATCYYDFKFPLFSAGSSLLVAGDTVVFGFDPAGNLTRADNRHARIRRSYAPNGALLTDTLRIRTVRYETEQHARSDPSGFQTHAYLLRYQYDSTGRLTGLTYPSQLCTSCSASYAYHDTTGALKRLTDPWANMIDFWHGPAGMLDSTGYPGAVKERMTYDAEGRVTFRSVKLTGGYPVIDDSLAYDPLGRIAGGKTYAAPTRRYRSVWNVYSGLGALAGMEQSFSDGADPKEEQFRTDALGNRTYHEKQNFSFSYEHDPARKRSSYDGNGRLHESYAVDEQGVRHNVGYWDNTIQHYDVPGNLRFRAYYRSSYEEQASEAWQQAHYYQGDGKLAVLERHDEHGEAEALGYPLTYTGLRDEYRYDALGRRVLVWSRRGASCTTTGCESSVRRAIWAGDQLVYETRGKGADSLMSAALEDEMPYGNGERGQPNAYGEVGYVHAGGIDHPIVVHRASTNTTFFPHANWRGLYDGATNASGQLIPCYGSNPAPCANVPDIDWPGSVTSAFIGATPSSRVNPAEWAGSLVTEQADASGLLYRRNRYYDPASGSFTQADPLGVASGNSAYGYAEGDPLNNHDPFGLYCEKKSGEHLVCKEVGPGDFRTMRDFLGGAQGDAAYSIFDDAGWTAWTPQTCQRGFERVHCDRIADVQAKLTLHGNPYCANLGVRSTRRFQAGKFRYHKGLIPHWKGPAIGMANWLTGTTTLSSLLFVGGAGSMEWLYNTNVHEEEHHTGLFRGERAARAAEKRCKQ